MAISTKHDNTRDGIHPLLRTVLDARGEALVAYDTELRVTEWNAATARNTGVSRADALGRSILDLFPYIRGTPIEEEYRRSLAGETVDARDREWSAAEGGPPRRYDVTYTPVRDEDGAVIGGVVLTTDVTARVGTDGSHAAELPLLRTILDSAPHSLVAVDCNLRIVEWNSCSENRTGVRRSTVIGRHMLEVMPDLAGTEVLRDYQRATAGTLREIRDRWYAIPGEEPRCYDVVFAPMHDGRGTVTGAIMLAQDVTDRARAQEDLAAERALLRTVLDSAPLGVVAFDAGGRITEWNQAAETVCGVKRADAIGQLVTDLAPARNDLELNKRRIERALVGEVMLGEAVAFNRPGESEQTRAEASVAPLRDAQGHVVGGVAVVVDVTERVRAEADRQRLISDLDAERERAVRASQAKSAMLAGLSHELRTPLGAVLGFAQLLRDGRAGALTAEQLEYVDDVLTGAGYLLRVVNDALDLARVEAGVVEMRPERIDVRALVAETLATVAPLASAHRITVATHFQDEVPLTADPGRVRQVLLNYLSNALKYSHAGDEVVVEVARDGERGVRLTVRDNGPGIPAAEMGRLFVEFQRLSSDREVPGSGLGLAITKRLVEAMGGSVSAESSPGGGSAFHAVLPMEPAR